MAVENSSKLSFPSWFRSIASKPLRAMSLSWKPALTNDLANSSSCRKPSPLTSTISKNCLHPVRYVSLNSGSFLSCRTDSTMMDGVSNPLSSNSVDFIQLRQTYCDITILMDIRLRLSDKDLSLKVADQVFSLLFDWYQNMKTIISNINLIITSYSSYMWSIR